MRAPKPSQRLSNANRAFAPAFEDWYSSLTNERPNSIVCGRYSCKNLSEKSNMWLVAIRGLPDSFIFISLPMMKRYPPSMSFDSGSHTISCRHGGSMTSKSSMSQLLPVPPPAARKAISRKRPISRIVLGHSLPSMTYISLLLLFVIRSRRSRVKSASISDMSTGAIMFSVIVLWSYR